MSSRTISAYRIEDPAAVERRRVQEALNEWALLRGRASALAQRCEKAGHPECAVSVGQPTAADSASIQRECNELQTQIAASAARLEKAQLDDQARLTNAALESLLDDLARREAVTPERTVAPTEAPAEPAGERYAERIREKLATLAVDLQALFRKSAGDILAEADPARAGLLYDDLVQRIALANKRVAMQSASLSDIAELRSQLERLPGPGAARALVDSAEDAVARGADPSRLIEQAREALARELQAQSARFDLEFVQRAVKDSLVDVGYEVLDVGLETAETLVFRQSAGYGVCAEIKADHIDLHTVRLETGATAGGSNRDKDRDADDELCRRLEGFRAGMGRRGVTVTVRETQLPGTVEPSTVNVVQRSERPARADKKRHRPHARELGAE